jgi:hypothetical protein
LSENRKGGEHLEELGVDRKIILERNLGKEDEMWTGWIWLRIGTNGGL